jgi:YbbR domain-containing protein
MIKLLTANLPWKALSLLIALGLWFALVREPELVTSHSAPIFFRNLPRDLEIGSDVPDRVHVEIRGPSGRLTPESLSDTAVEIDLSAVQAPGERTFTISAASLNLPTGVTFLRAVPSQLRLRFDRVLSKDVPVQVRTSAPPPSGYRVVWQEVRPERLRITGPENRVQEIEAAQTDPIDLSGVVSQAEFRVNAYLSDTQVRFDSAPVVTVKLVVQKIQPGK